MKKSKYIVIPLNRLYNGYIADVRSYIYDKAVKNKQGLKFHVLSTSRWMTVPFNKLSEGEHNARIEKSKYDHDYHLVMFKFTPDEVKEKAKQPVQATILSNYDNASRMLEIMKTVLHR